MNLRVVTPTLGQSPWLDETVASVRTLGLAGGHVLVTPAAEAAALAERFGGVTVVAERAAGSGLYAAINDGLVAPGPWDAFTYLNDDDLLRPGFAAVVAHVGPAAGPLLVYGRVELIDGTGRRLGAIPVSTWPRYNRALYAQRLEPVYQHGAVITRAAWEQCGGFDPSFRYCGDSEFLARLCVREVPAVYAGGAVGAFRLHRGQLTKHRSAMIEERARVDQKLGLLPPRLTLGDRWAWLAFRTANLPIYAERIARHGFITFDELLERSA